MACDAADTTAATGSRACEINMRITRFRAPELLVCSLRIAVNEGKFQVTMEDVSAWQRDVLLQIERRFHFDRERAVAAWSEDGFNGIEQILIQTGNGVLLGQCLGALRIAIKELCGGMKSEKSECVKTV